MSRAAAMRAMEARFSGVLLDAENEARRRGWDRAAQFIRATSLTFNLRGRSAGMARIQHDPQARHGAPKLLQCRLNLAAYKADPEDMLNDTIPHEVAHLLCMLQRTDRGHGPVWREVCIALDAAMSRARTLDLIIEH